MSQKAKSDLELWKALDGLDDDLLDLRVSESVVDEELNALEIDATELGKRALEFVAVVKERERLSWQRRAEQRRAELEKRTATMTLPRGMSRQELLDRLEELRSADSRVGTAIKMAARKRKPEESSDEELRLLIEEMEALRAIERGDLE